MHLLQLSNCLKEETLWKVIFWHQWIIQCNTDSCCEHIAGGFNIHLYGCVSLLVLECAVYLCVYMRETQQGRSGAKVPRLDIYRSIISLSEIAHPMWHGHPFSQRNKKSKIAGGEGWKQQIEGLDKIFKRWLVNIDGLHNIEVVRNPLTHMTHKELF